ncbi:N-acetyltransferase [Staphylococcus aureus]|nr:N-acetyltransferase [Staphylococcus aureus]
MKHLESGECFVYKNNFEVLGCYILKEINKNRVELLDIAVRENKQGLGIGEKIYENGILCRDMIRFLKRV